MSSCEITHCDSFLWLLLVYVFARYLLFWIAPHALVYCEISLLMLLLISPTIRASIGVPEKCVNIKLVLSALIILEPKSRVWLQGSTEAQEIDLGSYFALSHFYGYLNFVLPDDGSLQKGLQSRLNEYIKKEELPVEEFPCKKLLLLIPTSGFLSKIDDDKHITARKNLRPVTRDRGCVRSRTYMNSVYMVKTGEYPKGQISVIAEACTPLQTIYEAEKNRMLFDLNEDSGEPDSPKFSRIIKSYMRMLQKLLNSNPECRRSCQLIYFNDEEEDAVRKAIVDAVKNGRLSYYTFFDNVSNLFEPVRYLLIGVVMAVFFLLLHYGDSLQGLSCDSMTKSEQFLEIIYDCQHTKRVY